MQGMPSGMCKPNARLPPPSRQQAKEDVATFFGVTKDQRSSRVRDVRYWGKRQKPHMMMDGFLMRSWVHLTSGSESILSGVIAVMLSFGDKEDSWWRYGRKKCLKKEKKNTHKNAVWGRRVEVKVRLVFKSTQSIITQSVRAISLCALPIFGHPEQSFHTPPPFSHAPLWCSHSNAKCTVGCTWKDGSVNTTDPTLQT